MDGISPRYVLAIQEDLWPVEYDERQMSLAIKNLLLNACQAMREDRMIDITAENCTIGEKHTLPLAD